jgi:hypothetical protein
VEWPPHNISRSSISKSGTELSLERHRIRVDWVLFWFSETRDVGIVLLP